MFGRSPNNPPCRAASYSRARRGGCIPAGVTVMPSVFAVGRYWCGVFGRAFLDTWRFLGHNVKKSVMSAIGVFITIVLIGAAEEESARALLRFHWWLYGAAGAVALFVLVMIVMILRTPPVVQEEAVRKATAAT